jgi:phosphoglycerate dehydrogenase-like enzyme
MSAPTVVVTANAFRESAPESEAPLRAAGVEVRYPARMGPLPPAELIAALTDADAVIAASDPYDDAVLTACPRLKAICRWGTGYDRVDLAACTRRKVAACNAPGLNAEAVADHVFAVLLALARDLPRQIAVMQTGGWEEIRGVELHRKTVGLVGFGLIGRAVARRARGFDCRVLAYDPHQPAAVLQAEGAEPVSLPDLFAAADFVSLHAALTPDNRGMIGADLLARMRPSAYFINAARGPLVDEDALLAVLRDGRIAGAAVDAFTDEPLPANHPFRTLPNCLATPHSAFNTREAAAATNAMVAAQVLAVLRGERPPHLLNPEAFD